MDIRPRHNLQTKAPGELTSEDLQDGCCGRHRRYRNKIVLAMLNSNVAPMPYIMFQLNPTYYSAADEI